MRLGIHSPLRVEILALLEGALLAKHINLCQAVFESDSLAVIKLIVGEFEDLGENRTLIQDIRVFPSTGNYHFVYVPRKANNLALNLAVEAISLNVGMSWSSQSSS